METDRAANARRVMISGRDIANGIGTTFAIAKGESDWAERADMSAEQVFKSLWALPLAFPGLLLSLEAQRRLAFENPVTASARLIMDMPSTAYFVSQAVVFVIVWAAEIALLAKLAQRREVGWKISPLIIGANWAKFVFTLAFGFITSLAIIGGVPSLAAIGGIVAYGLLFWLRWGLIRRTLDFTPARTAGTLAILVLAFFAISTVMSILLILFGYINLEIVQA